MLVKEVKSIIRKHLRQKVLFGINLLGLTIGFVFAILAFLYTQYEYKFDKHFTNASDTYLMACNNGRNHEMHFGQPPVFMEAILDQVPEVKSGIRIMGSNANLKINETRYKTTGFIYTESTFFSFLGWDLITGNPESAIANPMSVVISEKIADQFFKNTNPIGKSINIDNQFDLTITGVFKNLPEQSHIRADFITTFSTRYQVFPNNSRQWGWHNSLIYLKTKPNTNIAAIEKKIADVWNMNSEDKACIGPHVRSTLLPFKDIYLHAENVTGRMSAFDYIIGVTAVAALILLISCLNFVNLSVGINAKQKVENGVKKVLGAGNKIFIRQSLIEMGLFLFCALVLSLLILNLSLTQINTFFAKTLTISLFHNISLVLFIVLLLVLVTLICGSIPLLQMIRSKANMLLKGNTRIIASNMSSSKSQKAFRNSLVIAQFTIGIILITFSIVINNQLKFIRQHDMGFNKEQIMVIDNYEGLQSARYGLLRDYVKNFPGVKSITSGSDVPLDGISNWGGPNVDGNKQTNIQGVGFVSVDENYLELIGAKIKEGRNFKYNHDSEKDKIIITETLARSLNLSNPIGVRLGDLWDNTRREVVGVVKDIEFNSIHTKNLPIIFFYKRSNDIRYCERIMVKLQSDNLQATIGAINKYWDKISPDYSMEYTFLNDSFARNYANETRTSTFMNVMTVVAVILCSMGLFGLALFHINARIKEIGVRKVNGAHVFEVIKLLNTDFIEWIAVSFVFAVPIAWYVLNKWLENFAYKTELSWWVFILAGILALLIALITVSFQSYRAATRNPVESLRYE